MSKPQKTRIPLSANVTAKANAHSGKQVPPATQAPKKALNRTKRGVNQDKPIEYP